LLGFCCSPEPAKHGGWSSTTQAACKQHALLAAAFGTAWQVDAAAHSSMLCGLCDSSKAGPNCIEQRTHSAFLLAVSAVAVYTRFLCWVMQAPAQAALNSNTLHCSTLPNNDVLHVANTHGLCQLVPKQGSQPQHVAELNLLCWLV
jgi:hypothetical protein